MRYLFILSVLALLMACKKEGASTTPGMETVDTTTAQLKFMGDFMRGPYGNASGKARVYMERNGLVLALENFNVNNGPDLYVYLSKEVQPVNFISLGKLKAISGNQVYGIVGNPDFSEYKYALIHCQRFNHLFGSAELK